MRRIIIWLPAAILLVVAGSLAVEPGQPSKTAVTTLQLRALGVKIPDPDLRNPDGLAASFLGPREHAILTAMPMGRVYADLDFPTAWKEMPEIYRRVLLHVLARTRLIDDTLRDGVAEGATQVVILGAGYDSRAYRFREMLRGATVYELDLPPSQEYKKLRLREVVGEIPGNVLFVPIDFTKEDLWTVLRRAGYRESRKSVFIWEGVTEYIPERAVSATLEFVARHSALGSRIVFDYESDKAVRNDNDDAVLKSSNARLAAMGEPHIFGFPGGSARGFVERHGLTVVEDLTPAEVTRRYLTANDGTKLGEERWSNGICVAMAAAKGSRGR